MALAYDNAASPSELTTAGGASSVTVSSNSFSPAAGEVIVFVVCSDNNSSTTNNTTATPTNTGTALTWTKAGENHPTPPSFNGDVSVWWAFNASAQTGIVVSAVVSNAVDQVTDSMVAV